MAENMSKGSGRPGDPPVEHKDSPVPFTVRELTDVEAEESLQKQKAETAERVADMEVQGGWWLPDSR